MRSRASRTATGPQALAGRSRIPRHRHRSAYAALVLEGGYEEAGDCGRFFVEPGDIVVHPAFDAHLDRAGRAGALLHNIALPDTRAWTGGVVRDASDELWAAARRGEHDAFGQLLEAEAFDASSPADWPDALAAALRVDPSLRLDVWARAAGLRPETISRGFTGVFGVSPKRYRAEARAQAAVTALRCERRAMSRIAADLGFADQAHMSRAIRALTGSAPSELAAGSSPFKPAPARPV